MFTHGWVPSSGSFVSCVIGADEGAEAIALISGYEADPKNEESILLQSFTQDWFFRDGGLRICRWPDWFRADRVDCCVEPRTWRQIHSSNPTWTALCRFLKVARCLLSSVVSSPTGLAI